MGGACRDKLGVAGLSELKHSCDPGLLFASQVCKEQHRFEKLMEYFRNEDSNIDFMVRSKDGQPSLLQRHEPAFPRGFVYARSSHRYDGGRKDCGTYYAS